jgi:hypothetical protein
MAVLLEVGEAAPQDAVPEFAVEKAPDASGCRVRTDAARQSTVLLAFPDDWYWIEEANRAVVVVPNLPSAVEVLGGEIRGVWAYDHISASFLPAPLSSLADARFDVPVVSPDLYGYRIAIDCLDPHDVDVEFRRREPLGASAPSDIAFGVDVNERRVHELEARLDEKESSRAALQQMYEDTYERLQEMAAAYAALNDLANAIEASRSRLESQQASGAAERLSSWVAERRCKEAYDQIGVLNRELISAQEKLYEIELRKQVLGAVKEEQSGSIPAGKLRRRRRSRGS